MNHQDWETVLLRGKTGRASASQTGIGKAGGGDSKTSAPSLTAEAARDRRLDAANDAGTHEKVSKSVSSSIASARALKKMTRGDLARALNVKESVIAMYETGKAIPDKGLINRIGRVLGTKIA